MKKHNWIGREIKDKVTGLKGICTGYCQHITGCNTFAIVKDESNTIWFDENRLELTKKGNKKRIEFRSTEEGLTGAGDDPQPSRSMP